MNGAADPRVTVSSEEELRAHLRAFGIVARSDADLGDPPGGILHGKDEDGREVQFRVQRSARGHGDHPLRLNPPAAGTLDEFMVRAALFSADNPPHHPGTVARFPMPSERFGGCVEVPLAVLAVNAGRPGLYAPPRVVVLDWQTAEPRGIGEFPGFSPDAWPPPRLGDWPPSPVLDIPAEVVAASIVRLSGCLGRLIDHALGEASNAEASDIRDAARLLRRLESPGMFACYQAISPDFSAMLGIADASQEG